MKDETKQKAKPPETAKNQQERLCYEPEKLWCAMCGKWGDHRSGGCPEFKIGV